MTCRIQAFPPLTDRCERCARFPVVELTTNLRRSFTLMQMNLEGTFNQGEGLGRGLLHDCKNFAEGVYNSSSQELPRWTSRGTAAGSEGDARRRSSAYSSAGSSCSSWHQSASLSSGSFSDRHVLHVLSVFTKSKSPCLQTLLGTNTVKPINLECYKVIFNQKFGICLHTHFG